MKTKILIALLFILSTVSCNTSTQENTVQQEQNADTLKQVPAAEDGKTESEHHEGEVGVTPLSLNNGMKWKADNVTNENVRAIKKVVSEFAIKANPILHDYHNVADKISEAINKLLADCKMTGAEHEALHNWLLPLIYNTKELVDSKDMNTAGKVFSEINEKLNTYNHYFD